MDKYDFFNSPPPPTPNRIFTNLSCLFLSFFLFIWETQCHEYAIKRFVLFIKEKTFFSLHQSILLIVRFMGCHAILSGPAGGVVGYAKTTFDEKSQVPIIGFDMGG